MCDEQRVAVGGCLGHHRGGDRAARAAAILDHELLPELCRQSRRDEPRDDVDPAAGGERHQHFDRFRRPGLCVCGCGECGSGRDDADRDSRG